MRYLSTALFALVYSMPLAYAAEPAATTLDLGFRTMSYGDTIILDDSTDVRLRGYRPLRISNSWYADFSAEFSHYNRTIQSAYVDGTPSLIFNVDAFQAGAGFGYFSDIVHAGARYTLGHTRSEIYYSDDRAGGAHASPDTKATAMYISTWGERFHAGWGAVNGEAADQGIRANARVGALYATLYFNQCCAGFLELGQDDAQDVVAFGMRIFNSSTNLPSLHLQAALILDNSVDYSEGVGILLSAGIGFDKAKNIYEFEHVAQKPTLMLLNL